MSHISSYKELRVYQAAMLDQEYDWIIGQLVRMIDRPEQWLIHPQKRS